MSFLEDIKMINDIYNKWLKYTDNEQELYNELISIKDNEKEIEDRFYKELKFGTAGLRGELGAGTNRMNIYTVGKATEGYCRYLLKQSESPSVAIAYDSRINSTLFSERAASVFASHGITVYIYNKLMPTPALSFAVRDLNCDGGVVITASHNPAKYNGYKAYGPDGCQITSNVAQAIEKEIESVDPFLDVKALSFVEGIKSGLIRFIEEDTIKHYYSAIASASLLPKEINRDISIVYTPLNGAGISCVPECLSQNGFTNIIIPEEQSFPDGNFVTCPYPNPEIKEALEIGLKKARETGSDLLIATDPDCDRVGTAVRIGEDYRLINGNEMGVLLLDFICKMRKMNKTMSENAVAVKTIVSTPLAEKIAKHYEVSMRNVLTGFKYIGEQIGHLEKEGKEDYFIFGFEESYGYLSGSFVRDKDAVNASLLICEMFAFYRSLGMTLIDALDDIYNDHGFYDSKLLSFTFEGLEGFTKMNALLDSIRKDIPSNIANIKVIKTIDYDRDETGLPKSNVLSFLLEDGSNVIIRPSGTEPKLKVYLLTTDDTKEHCSNKTALLRDYFEALLK